jgi:hypothetical protein
MQLFAGGSRPRRRTTTRARFGARYVLHLERLERKPLWAALVALEIAAWGLVLALEETWSALLLGAVLVTMAVWAWRHERQKSK